jgi:hypothetical protein
MYSSESADKACALINAESSCVAPKCSWTASECEDICVAITDLHTCNDTHSAEMISPSGSFLWGCVWVHCLGTPLKKFCSDYSVNQCPSELGCSVEKVNAF